MRPVAVHEMVVDPSTMTITVGSKVFDRPLLHPIPEWDTGIKEQIVERPSTNSVKEVNAFYCRELGPKFNRRFRAAMYHLWIGNRMSPATGNMLRLSGHTGWRRYSPDLVWRANQVLPYIKEAEADGLLHLIPAIVVFGASPSAIRREIGKGAWKRIAANSRTRNMRIMQATEATFAPSDEHWKQTFVKLLSVRSGHLGGAMRHIPIDDIVEASRLAPRCTPMSLLETLHIVRDARRMLGEINPAWGLPRIKREHDAAMLEQRRKRYSPAPFTEAWSFSDDGFTADLLVSPLDIVAEGDTQHHCVGSYASDAADNRYAVLKVEGKERATIGLRRTAEGWLVDQVYAACNAPVSAACRVFAFRAADALTEQRLHSIPTTPAA